MPARNILVINCGSSSIKFALVNEAHSQFSLSGLTERLGSPDAVLHWQRGGEKDSLMIPGADHRAALSQLLPLVQGAAGGKLHGIGHRVVHGGERFTQAQRITRPCPSTPTATPCPSRCTASTGCAATASTAPATASSATAPRR